METSVAASPLPPNLRLRQLWKLGSRRGEALLGARGWAGWGMGVGWGEEQLNPVDWTRTKPGQEGEVKSWKLAESHSNVNQWGER